jgi:hypothetical protein
MFYDWCINGTYQIYVAYVVYVAYVAYVAYVYVYVYVTQVGLICCFFDLDYDIRSPHGIVSFFIAFFILSTTIMHHHTIYLLTYLPLGQFNGIIF